MEHSSRMSANREVPRYSDEELGGGGSSQLSNPASGSGMMDEHEAAVQALVHPEGSSTGCLGRFRAFFCRPSYPSYFDLRAPLGSSVFARTMTATVGASNAERARQEALVPVAQPVGMAGAASRASAPPASGPGSVAMHVRRGEGGAEEEGDGGGAYADLAREEEAEENNSDFSRSSGNSKHPRRDSSDHEGDHMVDGPSSHQL